jgi:hypothetical protein
VDFHRSYFFLERSHAIDYLKLPVLIIGYGSPNDGEVGNYKLKIGGERR